MGPVQRGHTEENRGDREDGRGGRERERERKKRGGKREGERRAKVRRSKEREREKRVERKLEEDQFALKAHRLGFIFILLLPSLMHQKLIEYISPTPLLSLNCSAVIKSHINVFVIITSAAKVISKDIDTEEEYV